MFSGFTFDGTTWFNAPPRGLTVHFPHLHPLRRVRRLLSRHRCEAPRHTAHCGGCRDLGRELTVVFSGNSASSSVKILRAEDGVVCNSGRWRCKTRAPATRVLRAFHSQATVLCGNRCNFFELLGEFPSMVTVAAWHARKHAPRLGGAVLLPK
jgi:hypothetical protein